MTITLYNELPTGDVDPFGRPGAFLLSPGLSVDNVLIAPVSADDISEELNLSGKHAEYQLGIPKGDTNTWENSVVEFFGQKWRTIGYPTEGIESMIPLDWNRKIRVERFNESIQIGTESGGGA